MYHWPTSNFIEFNGTKQLNDNILYIIIFFKYIFKQIVPKFILTNFIIIGSLY